MSVEALDASLREAFGRVVYSHKTHLKEVEQLNESLDRWKWARLILLSLTTGGVITNLVHETFVVSVFTALSSSLSLALLIYQLSFNHERAIQDHRRAATRLWGIREEYENLIADIKDGGLTEEAARSKRDDITKRLQDIYAECPDTHYKAYEAARRALKINEDMTFSAEEVDRFLPVALRRPPTREPLDLPTDIGLQGSL